MSGKGEAGPGTPWPELVSYTTFPVPLPTGRGTHHNIIGLRVQDGTEWFGCIACEVAWQRVGFARVHLGRAHPSAITARKRAQRAEQALNEPEPDRKARTRATKPLKRRTAVDASSTTTLADRVRERMATEEHALEPTQAALPDMPEPPGRPTQRHISRTEVEAGIDLNGVLLPRLMEQVIESRAAALAQTARMRSGIGQTCEMLRNAAAAFLNMAEQLEATTQPHETEARV